MDFSIFIQNIDKLKQVPLGGHASQFKMAPAVRPFFDLNKIEERKPKSSAVLALFYPNEQDKTCFVLTKRAQYIGVHSNQISFPGGKVNKGDSNLVETALRETYEEINIKNVIIFRQLTTTYIPPSNFYVTPFLGYIDQYHQFKPNHEVNEVLEIDLEDFLDDSCLSIKNLNTSYMKAIDVPCFKLNNHIVWGATAMMLSEIKDMFKAL